MTDQETQNEEPTHPLMGERCAVYLPSGTWFAIMTGATEHDLTFTTESGESRVYPRGKYDVRKAIDRPRE